MPNSLRWISAALGLLALGAVGLLIGPGASAEERAAAPQSPGTWVYDVRVVRVDTTDSTVLEVAPPWQPAAASGASTTAAWADLLAGLKGRGRTTILFDQRLTALPGVQTTFRQDRRRPFLGLQSRAATNELWQTSYVETGTSGDLLSTAEGLTYRIDVRWEEASMPDATAPLGTASWKGSRSNFAAGETLVLPHRQQQVAETAISKGLEIYVFVTGWAVPAK